MATLRTNVLANFGGQAWSVIMGVAFVPVYVRLLGIEAYGLIGFFLSLQAFFLVLDMGISATLNRELARHRHTETPAAEQRNLVRTLETLYWPVGVAIAFGVWLASGAIAHDWLNPVHLSGERTAHAVVLLGIGAGLQWPNGLYAGGLRGLERHVELNWFNAFFATLRYVGVIGVLTFISPSLEAFLWWQIAISGLQSVAMGLLLWRYVPKASARPTFDSHSLRRLSSFTFGLACIGLLGFVLTQADRLILSRLVPLDEFGFYALAATVATALSSVVQPFFAALYPRYSALVAAHEWPRLSGLYHLSNQMLAVVVCSTASVVAWFAHDILLLWSRDAAIASRSGPILSLLVIGTALNGLMNLPYALQLATGWTRLALGLNAVSVAIVLPATWWLGSRYGGWGVAWVWVALNLGYVCIGIPLMHRRLLKGEMRNWYLSDVLPPAFAAVVVAGLMSYLCHARLALPVGVACLAGTSALTLACAAVSAPAVRAYARQWLQAR